jgi:glutaconate CoA-transferase subunit A
MSSKVVPLREAIAAHVHDGDTMAIEGFTHLISFAAAHEVIRQGRRDLVLARLTPDLVYDQMVAAGCASKLVFSWLGNPGVGSLHAIRRAIEAGQLEIEEYSHHGMVARYAGGASRLPFFPLRSYDGSDLAAANPLIRSSTRNGPMPTAMSRPGASSGFSATSAPTARWSWPGCTRAWTRRRWMPAPPGRCGAPKR